MSAIKLLSAATLFRIALPLAFVVVVAGAYTRIADAGLGCPDWPGCYGKLAGVPSAAEAAEYLASGAKDAPGGFDRQKAVIEIAHRYIAGLLGLLILAAAFLARKDGRRYFVTMGDFNNRLLPVKTAGRIFGAACQIFRRFRRRRHTGKFAITPGPIRTSQPGIGNPGIGPGNNNNKSQRQSNTKKCSGGQKFYGGHRRQILSSVYNNRPI